MANLDPAVRVSPTQDEAALALTMRRWKRLSLALCAIIGEHGFASLYARCLHQTGTSFSWLSQSGALSAEAALALLDADLRQRPASEATAACDALLGIFIDTLIVLLGELFTNRILLAAWDDDGADAAEPEPQA